MSGDTDNGLTDYGKALNRIRDLERQREIIYDISFAVSSYWSRLGIDVASKIMDHLSGSRGLFDLVCQWADEFDTKYEAGLPESAETYLNDVDDFAIAKINVLVTTIRLD